MEENKTDQAPKPEVAQQVVAPTVDFAALFDALKTEIAGLKPKQEPGEDWQKKYQEVDAANKAIEAKLNEASSTISAMQRKNEAMNALLAAGISAKYAPNYAGDSFFSDGKLDQNKVNEFVANHPEIRTNGVIGIVGGSPGEQKSKVWTASGFAAAIGGKK